MGLCVLMLSSPQVIRLFVWIARLSSIGIGDDSLVKLSRVSIKPAVTSPMLPMRELHQQGRMLELDKLSHRGNNVRNLLIREFGIHR